MRQMMTERLEAAAPDRRTIMEFLDWIAARHGPLVSLLQSGATQRLDLDLDLDIFYDIDRSRMAEEG